MQQISHMFWGIWALVQGAISTIDFDFVDYAGLRFAEYYRRKDEFLGLE
jgi:ethanolamine kinase